MSTGGIEERDDVDNEEEGGEPGAQLLSGCPQTESGVKTIDFGIVVSGDKTEVRVSYNDLVHAVDLVQVATGKNVNDSNEVHFAMCLDRFLKLGQVLRDLHDRNEFTNENYIMGTLTGVWLRTPY